MKNRNHGETMQSENATSHQGEAPASEKPDALVNEQTASEKYPVLECEELLRLPSVHDRIAGILGGEDECLLVGKHGSGKALLALDMGLHIALGANWQGRKIRRGPVVYVATEHGEGIMPRIAAWCERYGVIRDRVSGGPPLPFDAFLSPVSLCKCSEEEFTYFVEQLRDFEKAFEKKYGPLALIIFEDLARCMGGGSEKSARDVGIVLDTLGRIRRAFGCACIVIRRCEEDGEADASEDRGRATLLNSADTVIHVARHQSPEGGEGGMPSVGLTAVKMRNGAEFAPFTVALDQAENLTIIQVIDPNNVLGDWLPQRVDE
jgi:RecA-family ATPase